MVFFCSSLQKNLIFAQKIAIMIQRIQTLYLLVSVILIGLLFALPFAEISSAGAIYLFNFKGIILDNVIKENGIAISVLILLVIIMHGIAILNYKKRILQIRLIVFTILLMLGLFGLFLFFTYFSFTNAQISFKISLIFPLIAIILDYLAIRSIGKDEALIRSIDRIR
jgi:hypothetical protein